MITHPFHPRRGERFRVVKARRYCGQATLVLEAAEGSTFAVLEEWTDRAAPPQVAGLRLLSAPALLELAQLMRQLQAAQAPQAAPKKGVDRCS